MASLNHSEKVGKNVISQIFWVHSLCSLWTPAATLKHLLQQLCEVAKVGKLCYIRKIMHVYSLAQGYAANEQQSWRRTWILSSTTFFSTAGVHLPESSNFGSSFFPSKNIFTT